MKHRVIVFTVILLFFQFISCNDELVVDQNEQINSTENLNLSKEVDQLSIQKDSISQKEKKERILNLKKEHEKPYVVIDKPEKLLAEKLKSRTPDKSFSKSAINSKLKSVQGSQSCYTLEIDVWALERYFPKLSFSVGILPKSSYNYPDNLYWQYDQNILSILKNKYGYSLIILEPQAVFANTVFPANQIVVGIDGCNPFEVYNFCNSYTGASLWGMYTDEPFSRDNPMPTEELARTNLSYSSSLWKAKFGQISKFIVGETNVSDTYKIASVSDFVNCSWYGYYIWPLTNDQRSRWTDFNNAFTYQFNYLWISGARDKGEMDLLFGHARNMNKNNVWLYAGERGVADISYWEAIEEFNYFAFVHSYLTRQEKKFVYLYNYIGNDDPCYDYQITSWDLIDIIDSGVTRVLSN